MDHFVLTPYQRAFVRAAKSAERLVMYKGLHDLIGILADQGPMSAGQVGYALWANRATVCKCENAQATMYCRPAGRLLHRARRQGLVRYEDRGRRRVWMMRKANDLSEGSDEGM